MPPSPRFSLPDELRRPILALLLPVLLLWLWSAHAVFVLGDRGLYAEDGPLENLQVALLAASCAGFLLAAAQRRAAERVPLLACALLCLGFMLRELDVERLPVPEIVRLVGAGPGRVVLLSTGLAALVGYAARHRRGVAAAARSFLRSASGVALMLAAPLLVGADLVEKGKGIPHFAYWEEMLEIVADALILVSAWVARRRRAAMPAGEERRLRASSGARPGR